MESLREMVAHLPPAQRELVGAVARWLPASVRYGPTFRTTYRDILHAETVPYWAREQVRARLQALFRAASGTEYYGTTPGYAALLREGDPLERLRALPVMTREQLSDHYEHMLAVPRSAVDTVSTSGSSGRPIVFYLDKARAAAEWAYVYRSWERTGFGLDDWRAYFRGLDLPHRADHFVQRSTREVGIRVQSVSPELLAEHWKLIVERRIKFLHGYPATLAYFARLLEEHGGDTSWRHMVRGIFPVSEEFTSAQHQVLKRVFPQADMISFYGLSERTGFAVMDEDRNFDFYPLYGVPEVLREDGTPATVGERGRLVTTGLALQGMPFLRYDTGDSVEVVGHDLYGNPRVREFKARRGREGLVTATGELFPTTSLGMDGDMFAVVHRYRVLQEEPGKAVLLVHPSPTASAAEIAEFHLTMARRTEGQVELALQVVQHLEPTVNGKFRLVDQRIPGAPTAWA